MGLKIIIYTQKIAEIDAPPHLVDQRELRPLERLSQSRTVRAARIGPGGAAVWLFRGRFALCVRLEQHVVRLVLWSAIQTSSDAASPPRSLEPATYKGQEGLLGALGVCMAALGAGSSFFYSTAEAHARTGSCPPQLQLRQAQLSSSSSSSRRPPVGRLQSAASAPRPPPAPPAVRSVALASGRERRPGRPPSRRRRSRLPVRSSGGDGDDDRMDG